MPVTNRALGGLGALGCALACFAPACGDDERPPPSIFGSAARGGAGGAGGVNGKGGRGGKGAGGGGGDTEQGAAAGERANGATGGEGEAGGDAGGSSGSGGDVQGGSGGKSGKGGSGGTGATGGTGAVGGTDGMGAFAGALQPGPDLDCPDVSESAGPTPLCDPDADWGGGATVLDEPGGVDAFLSLAANELTIAWRYSDALSPAYYTAERDNPGDAFGPARQLSDPAIAGAENMALSPDGLRLAVAANDEFVELVRQSRTLPFVSSGQGTFVLIDADAAGSASRLGDPVISADDLTLYYSLIGSPDGYSLRVSQRQPGELWPVGEALAECDLMAHTTGMRRPTAVSADGLTLFYNDEPRRLQRAAFRSSVDRPFSVFVDLAAYGNAQPNAACDKLYYSALHEGQLQVLVSDER